MFFIQVIRMTPDNVVTQRYYCNSVSDANILISGLKLYDELVGAVAFADKYTIMEFDGKEGVWKKHETN